jgi:hypothetical protein
MNMKRIVLIVGGVLVALAAMFPHLEPDYSYIHMVKTDLGGADEAGMAAQANSVFTYDRFAPWRPHLGSQKVDMGRTELEVFGLAFLTFALWMAAPGDKGAR